MTSRRLSALVLAFGLTAPLVGFAAPAVVTHKAGAYPGQTVVSKRWTLRHGAVVQHDVTSDANGKRVGWMRRVERTNRSFKARTGGTSGRSYTVGGYLGNAYLTMHQTDQATLIAVLNGNNQGQTAFRLAGTEDWSYSKSKH